MRTCVTDRHLAYLMLYYAVCPLMGYDMISFGMCICVVSSLSSFPFLPSLIFLLWSRSVPEQRFEKKVSPQ